MKPSVATIIFTAATTMAGGIVWLTQLNFVSVANAEAIIEMKIDSKEYHRQVLNELKTMNERLSRIEGALK